MLLDTIKDIITENTSGNILEKTYAGMRYRFDIAQRFPKTKIVYWDGDYEYNYHCTEDDVKRVLQEVAV